MFFPRTLPLPLEAGRLLSARFTLNTPTISSGEVPSGPARAAIVVYANERDGRGLAIAIRSLRTSDVTLFTFEDALETEADVVMAIDAALSFGESMGFLFDDDSVVEGDPESARAAIARWRELTAGSSAEAASPPAEPDEAPFFELPPSAARESADPSPPAEPELMLEDALEALEPVPRPASDPAPSPAAARPEPDAAAAEVPPVSSAVPLSKFRRPAPQASARSGGGATLGRIPLRKRRPVDTEERPSLLLRILGGF